MRDRTADLLRARQALSQLSYDPINGDDYCKQQSVRDQVIEVSACVGELSVVKEVIQPQVPLRLPCYDFTPVMNHTVVTVLFAVRLATSGATHSHGVTGGVYKARERIHRGILIRDY